ncbi:hypothetical protein EBT31_07025 [bacterium]|nr:hypothetical protein [bacterium]
MGMQKDTKIALGFCGFFLGLLVLSAVVNSGRQEALAVPGEGVTVVDGVQRIEILARGGYSPERVVATAGMPTEILLVTDGTYDCSSSVVIPSLKFRKFLQPSGTEIISLSAEQATGTLKGGCSMGMYNFQIAFE